MVSLSTIADEFTWGSDKCRRTNAGYAHAAAAEVAGGMRLRGEAIDKMGDGAEEWKPGRKSKCVVLPLTIWSSLLVLNVTPGSASRIGKAARNTKSHG